MTEKFKIGDRVKFHVDTSDADNGFLGTVIDYDFARFVVKWDDDLQCSYKHQFSTIIKVLP